MAMPALPAIWNIPFQRNPFFTGREDILSHLDRALHVEQRVALSQPQGITGLGGIGKTQTVIEYAYRHREEYDAILWVRADSLQALTSGMVELAQILKLPERNETDQDIIVQAVLHWLHLHRDWLLIYDNIDDFSLAEPFLPKAGAGHLLFTTRAQALGGLAQRLNIQQMDPEIGALLLLRRASLLALQATLNMANSDEQRLAQAISLELDGPPLALDQAGAYIKEAPCQISDYLARYQARRSEILRVRGSFDQDYPASVATTWSLSFEKVSQAHPAAPELLKFFAFLAPDAIPEELLTIGAVHLGPILSSVVTDPLHLDQVCKEILRYSLFQRGQDENTFTMHRLVQAVLRDSLPTRQSKRWAPQFFRKKEIETQEHWMFRAISAVEEAYPNPDFVHWSDCERLLPHVRTCVTWIEHIGRPTTSDAHLFSSAGGYLMDRRRFSEAEQLLVYALNIHKEKFGPRHINTAHCLNNLGALYHDQGRNGEAEALLLQGVKIITRVFGKDHLEIAPLLGNLGSVYQTQSRYEEAEPLIKQALAINKREKGDDHLDTAKSLNNMAEFYQMQKKYMLVEPLFKQAIKIYEQQQKTSTPFFATMLHNLAMGYVELEKDNEAEPLLHQALTIREKVLWDSHPHTVSSMNNLAKIYERQDPIPFG